jgi:aminoglycoside phosphotransferase (APT) family kinase protein
VRYEVDGVDGAGPTTVIGKHFADEAHARLLHEHLTLLADGPFASCSLRVPDPLGFLPDRRLVLYRHCAGQPLTTAVEPALVEEGVRRAARWLARLHGSAVRLPRTLSLKQEARSTEEWAEIIAGTRPELGSRADQLARAWAAGVEPARDDQLVPIHKDFHAGHVLLGDATYVIDLDEARQGDPAFDLAHFCTYLEATGRPAGADRALFLEEYSEATGWSDGGTFAPFSAYTWLKVAKQCALASGPFATASPKDRLATLQRALTEGERWLSE